MVANRKCIEAKEPSVSKPAPVSTLSVTRATAAAPSVRPIVLLVASGLVGAVAALGGVWAGSGATPQLPAPSLSVPSRPPALDAARSIAPESPSLVSLGDGYVLQALGADRLALLRFEESGDAPTLRIEKVYALRREPGRHLTDPAARASHDHYLDDLGREKAGRMDALRRELDALNASGSSAAAASARADALAEALFAEGDATTLLAQLESPRYFLRRPAALVLGQGGFWQAAPRLAEVIDESGASGDRARAILTGFAGRSIRNRSEFDLWWRTVSARDRFRQP